MGPGNSKSPRLYVTCMYPLGASLGYSQPSHYYLPLVLVLVLLLLSQGQIVNAWKADRTVAGVVLSERLGKLAATLAGWDSARIAQDDVVWKPPGSGPVTFHQDSAYISKQFVPVRALTWSGTAVEKHVVLEVFLLVIGFPYCTGPG